MELFIYDHQYLCDSEKILTFRVDSIYSNITIKLRIIFSFAIDKWSIDIVVCFGSRKRFVSHATTQTDRL